MSDDIRPEYPFRCDGCGRAHVIDTVIPNDAWNAIADGADMLCVVCIDRRLAAKGLKAEAEFFYAGAGLLSRLYPENLKMKESA